MSKKGPIYYYQKKGLSSKWMSRYLVINVKSDDGSREFSVFDDKASFYSKQKPIVSKQQIKKCETNKSSHEGNKKFGFRITTVKKKKFDFSANTEDSRKQWINSGVLSFHMIQIVLFISYHILHNI